MTYDDIIHTLKEEGFKQLASTPIYATGGIESYSDHFEYGTLQIENTWGSIYISDGGKPIWTIRSVEEIDRHLFGFFLKMVILNSWVKHESNKGEHSSI
jgi:hypothetical protein